LARLTEMKFDKSKQDKYKAALAMMTGIDAARIHIVYVKEGQSGKWSTRAQVRH